MQLVPHRHPVLDTGLGSLGPQTEEKIGLTPCQARGNDGGVAASALFRPKAGTLEAAHRRPLPARRLTIQLRILLAGIVKRL